MQSLNSVTFSGNIGKDPETKFVADGKSVTKFSIAVTNREKEQGQRVDKTMWLNVDLWGRDGLVGHLQKGKRVIVTGSLYCREWDGDDGKKRQFWGIRADQIELAGGGAPRQAADTEEDGPNW